MYHAGARFKPCSEARFLYRKHGPSRNVTDSKLFKRLRKEIVPEKPEVVATFYNQATPATTYLRCQLPARYLPAVVRPDVSAAMTDEGPVRFPEHRGAAAVFQFAGDKMRALAAAHMRVAGIRTLVEVDDNYLINPGKAIMNRQGWAWNIGEGPHTRQGHTSIVRDADGVIVTTRHLAEEYRKVNPNVFVCPNTVDPVDWPELDKPDDGVFRIVWSASQSHAGDAPLVVKAMWWAAQQKGVEVHCVGLNPRWKFHKQVPWVPDLDAYRSSFSHFDVGVAPVRPTPAGLGRSDVKALEYAMGGCLPVLSDVAPYEDWHDKPALMAKNADEFAKRIKWCVSNQDEVRRLALEARNHVLAERTTVKQVDSWREAFAG
jgi:hypothetical protein